MSFWSKIVGPAATIFGASQLASILFPETLGFLSVFGPSTPQVTGFTGVGPIANGAQYADLINGGTAAASVWSNPTVLASGILAGTSLLGGLFGPEAQNQDFLRQQATENAAEAKRQFDAKLAFEQAKLQQEAALQAQAIEAQAGAAAAAAKAQVEAAGIAADASKKNTLSAQIGQNAGLKGQALQIPLQARNNQSEAATSTGANAGNFFTNLVVGMQRPALQAAAR